MAFFSELHISTCQRYVWTTVLELGAGNEGFQTAGVFISRLLKQALHRQWKCTECGGWEEAGIWSSPKPKYFRVWMGVRIQSFGLAHYWNMKAIHGREIWLWTSFSRVKSWTVVWFKFMCRWNISTSQWPTFCGSKSFSLQPFPYAIWAAVISISSLPALTFYLRISPNKTLLSPLSPKRKFWYEGSRWAATHDHLATRSCPH